MENSYMEEESQSMCFNNDEFNDFNLNMEDTLKQRVSIRRDGPK